MWFIALTVMTYLGSSDGLVPRWRSTGSENTQGRGRVMTRMGNKIKHENSLEGEWRNNSNCHI